MTSVDYHVHSSFSPDARDDMRKMVEKAVSLNLEEIMFTDHFEFLSDGRPGRFCSSVDYIPRIVDEVLRLRDEYAGCIYVGLGLEIGQMQFAEKESKKIVNSYPFDFILASFHKVGGSDLMSHDYTDEIDRKRTLDSYLDGLLVLASLFDFDSLAHIDLIKRYSYKAGNIERIEEDEERVREILRTLIKRGKALEINTSLLRDFDEPMPGETVLSWFKEEGGEKITVGSDAHKREHIAFGFDRAEAMLRRCGFSGYYIYKDRKEKFISFDQEELCLS